MNITIEDKPALHVGMSWEEVPEYYKNMYYIFNTTEGKRFFELFAGFIFNEKFTTQTPSESVFAMLDGRKSVIRELILTLKVLDGISK